MKTALHFIFIFLPILACAQDLDKLKRPEICFETKTIDFGKIEPNSSGVFYYHFTNCGNEPLIIQQAQTSCGCLVCTWPREPIMPGKTGRIELKYDTQRVGRMTKSATLHSNAQSEPVVMLVLKGTVLPYPGAFIADSTVDFGTVKLNQKLHFELTNKATHHLNYKDLDTLKILKIEQIAGSETTLVPTKLVLEKGASAQLEFIVSDHKSGVFSKEWQVYFNDGREPILLKASGRISK